MGGKSSAPVPPKPTPVRPSSEPPVLLTAGGGREAPRKPNQVRPAPTSTLLGGTASSTKVELCVRCELNRKPTSTCVVVYSKVPSEKAWFKEGMSDPVENSSHPNYRKFQKSGTGTSGEFLPIDFSMHSVRVLRLEVYKVRDPMELSDLSSQHFMGCAEMPVAETVFARGRGDSWVSRELKHPYHKDIGHVYLIANEGWNAKNMMSIDLSSRGIRGPSFWSRPDPYCVLSTLSEQSLETFKARGSIDSTHSLPPMSDESLLGDGQHRHPLFRTEVSRGSWKRVDLSAEQINVSTDTAQLILEVWDFERLGEDKLLGSSIFSFSEIRKACKSSKPLELTIYKVKAGGRKKDRFLGDSRYQQSFKQLDSAASEVSGFGGPEEPEGGKKNGTVTMLVGMQRAFSFFDYLRGGLELRMVVGLDFTRSNRSVEDPRSLHYMNGQLKNDYVTVLRSVAEVINSYGSHKGFPAYGFGAKIPPSGSICSHCFAISGDFFAPELKGVDALVEAYQRSIHVVRLHGPTYLREVIQMAASYAAQNEDVHETNDNGVYMHFWVLLLITDGEIADRTETAEELCKVSKLPLYILAVGLGESDFSFLQGLSAEVKQMIQVANQADPDFGMERDMVTFVHYDEFRNRPPGRFGAALLGDLPNFIRDYYQARELNPWNLDKFEDISGKLHPIPIVEKTVFRPVGGMGGRSTRRATSKASKTSSRASTKDGEPSSPSLPSVTEGEEDDEEELDAVQVMQKKKAKQAELWKLLPQFLKDWREQMLEDAMDLGYKRLELMRCFEDGIAAGSLESLLDNLVNGGYGKSPSYKDLAQAVNLQPVEDLNDPRLSNLRKSAASPSRMTTISQAPRLSPQASARSVGSSPGRATLALAPGHAGRNSVDTDAGPPLPGVVVSPGTCTICLEHDIDTELQPCGHRIACHLCIPKLGVACPLCKQIISKGWHITDIA